MAQRFTDWYFAIAATRLGEDGGDPAFREACTQFSRGVGKVADARRLLGWAHTIARKQIESATPGGRVADADLHPDEAAFAATLRGYRQVGFVGGRLALREARHALGAPIGPSLPDDRGAPSMPPGFVGSVSHKRTLAVAIAARDVEGIVGVDLEDRAPARLRIADRVLRPPEVEALAAIAGDDPDEVERRRWQALLLRFSIKESIYKAIDPFVRRYVGFLEAEVHPDNQGGARVAMHLQHGEGPFTIDARYRWLPGRLLTSVRIVAG
jgi:4'-phosphopantetheinyl transferase EntD